MAVNFEPVCLLEVVDPAALYPNGDPMCPAGLGGFQTMSGTVDKNGEVMPDQHHALCSPICYRDSQCSWGNKCLLITARPEEGGADRSDARTVSPHFTIRRGRPPHGRTGGTVGSSHVGDG